METMERNNGSPPYGYKRVNNVLVPDENHDTLQAILAARRMGWSMDKIAAHLNKGGVTGPRGGTWTRQQIHRVVKATPQP